MAKFSIKRLKPILQEKYKWSPLGTASTPLKPLDYLEDGEVEADSVYHAWTTLREQDRELQVGDLLVGEDETVFLCTYSGFEEAAWLPPADHDLAKLNQNQPGENANAPREADQTRS